MHIARTRAAAISAAGLLAATLGFTATRALSDDKTPPAWTAPEAEAKKANPVPADKDSLALGKTVFARSCVMCHGELGKGDGPAAGMFDPQPRDLRDAKIVEQTDGSIFWKLTTGKKPMPSFEKSLTEQERWSVVNYLRVLAPPKKAETQNAIK